MFDFTLEEVGTIVSWFMTYTYMSPTPPYEIVMELGDTGIDHEIEELTLNHSKKTIHRFYKFILENIEFDIVQMKVFNQSKLIIKNPCGYNYDRRSHRDEPDDFVDPNPSFTWEAYCPDGITIKDIVEGVYMVKGSKFDTWYELFDALDGSTTSDTVTFITKFDHGS